MPQSIDRKVTAKFYSPKCGNTRVDINLSISISVLFSLFNPLSTLCQFTVPSDFTLYSFTSFPNSKLRVSHVYQLTVPSLRRQVPHTSTLFRYYLQPLFPLHSFWFIERTWGFQEYYFHSFSVNYQSTFNDKLQNRVCHHPCCTMSLILTTTHMNYIWIRFI